MRRGGVTSGCAGWLVLAEPNGSSTDNHATAHQWERPQFEASYLRKSAFELIDRESLDLRRASSRIRSRRRNSLLLVEDRGVDIRPELPDQEGSPIQTHV
jgi:hypothetical protein